MATSEGRSEPGMPAPPRIGLGDKVRVFIGSEPKAEIARKVLQSSIDRNTNATVEYTVMMGPDWEYDHTGFNVGTGFSLRRWMIPAACGWYGRAIYLDADQLVFGDIFDLWTVPDHSPEPGRAAWMTYQPSKFSPNAPHPQSSVMVIDCAAAKNLPFFHIGQVLAHLRKHNTKKAYGDLMFPNWMKPAPGKVGVEWNSLNVYAAGKTKLLHYTKEPEQPWYKPDHPLATLWEKELMRAIQCGYVRKEEFEEALRNWGRKEDWRNTNGLHPYYKDLLPRFTRVLEGK